MSQGIQDDFGGSIYAHREIIGEHYGVLNYDGNRNVLSYAGELAKRLESGGR